MRVENLRSPYDRVHKLMYFGRMIDKVRLKADGKLPPDYSQNLGTGFDGRCLRLLGVTYEQLVAEVKPGLSDEQLLEKCFELGRKPAEEEIEIWNDFMRKRGWNDEASEIVKKRKLENNMEFLDEVQTMFDFIDADEERFFEKITQRAKRALTP